MRNLFDRDRHGGQREERVQRTVVPEPVSRMRASFEEIIKGGKEMIRDQAMIVQELEDTKALLEKWKKYGTEVATENSMLRDQLKLSRAEAELNRHYADDARVRMTAVMDVAAEGLRESRQFAQGKLTPRVPRNFQLHDDEGAAELVSRMGNRDRPGSRFNEGDQER